MTKDIQCKNGCGILEKAARNKNVYGHALFEIEDKGDGVAEFNLNRGFVVIVYTCPVCGYVELYDAPPIEGQST